MSKRHTILCRESCGLRVLEEDEIWGVAEEVWRALPEHKITRAHIQARRMAAKIIKEKGSNTFLGASGSTHFGVSNDFELNSFDDGVERRDGKVFSAPAPSA